MRQQVIIIGGGNTFKNYREFLVYLKKMPLTIKKSGKKWKENLENDLGKNFETIRLRMPNTDNAKYREWKIIFEKANSFFSNDLILVGHSLGGMFLAKYLSENKFPRKIKALFLVAAPFHGRKGDDLNQFKLSNKIKNLSQKAEKIILYHSRDDNLVPLSDFKEYKKALPEAKSVVFDKKGHFQQSHFTELTREIKKIANIKKNKS